MVVILKFMEIEKRMKWSKNEFISATKDNYPAFNGYEGEYLHL